MNMVAINGKHAALEKLMAMFRRESLMLSVHEVPKSDSENGLQPTVFIPTKRGEKIVAVHKV
jgi:hypothetical protein